VYAGTSTLDLVEGDHVLLTGSDLAVGPMSARAVTVSLPLRIVRAEADVVRGIGAEWVLVPPDQVVTARGDGPPDPSHIDIVPGHQQRAHS